MPLTLLQKSSLTFCLPAVFALATRQWITAAASGLLAYTSVRYHGHAPVPAWLCTIDCALARSCVAVYTALCIHGWCMSHSSRQMFGLGAVGGMLSAGLYALEIRYQTKWKPLTLDYIHVAVQQAGCWAWLCYVWSRADSKDGSLKEWKIIFASSLWVLVCICKRIHDNFHVWCEHMARIGGER